MNEDTRSGELVDLTNSEKLAVLKQFLVDMDEELEDEEDDLGEEVSDSTRKARAYHRGRAARTLHKIWMVAADSIETWKAVADAAPQRLLEAAAVAAQSLSAEDSATLTRTYDFYRNPQSERPVQGEREQSLDVLKAHIDRQSMKVTLETIKRERGRKAHTAVTKVSGAAQLAVGALKSPEGYALGAGHELSAAERVRVFRDAFAARFPVAAAKMAKVPAREIGTMLDAWQDSKAGPKQRADKLTLVVNVFKKAGVSFTSDALKKAASKIKRKRAR